MTVYHYTDTARLPHIITDGKLRLEGVSHGDYPWQLLWGTTNAHGDRSASSSVRSPYFDQKGGALIRIASPRYLWTPWSKAKESWPVEDVQCLERTAADMGQEPWSWMCREEELSADHFGQISYRHKNEKWTDIDLNDIRTDTRLDGSAYVVIGSLTYLSRQLTMSNGARGYAVSPPLSIEDVSNEDVP